MKWRNRLRCYAGDLDLAHLFLVIGFCMIFLTLPADRATPSFSHWPQVVSSQADNQRAISSQTARPPSGGQSGLEANKATEMSAGPSDLPVALPSSEDACPEQEVPPLPERGTPGAREIWRAFKAPLPPAPVYDPPGPKHVGIQAGHWASEDAPLELEQLVGVGASSGGYVEADVTFDLAQRTVAILQSHGVEAEVLPMVIPPGYTAHAFVAIHADAYSDTTVHGFKIARPGFSSIPETDDVLVDDLYAQYQATTGMRRDDARITSDMRYYYAFNARRYCHALALGVPAAIIEAGYLTSPSDRYMLIRQPDVVAEGIARGVLSFLGMLDNTDGP